MFLSDDELAELSSPALFLDDGPRGRAAPRGGKTPRVPSVDLGAFLPVEGTGLSRSLDRWFQALGIAPRIVAEFDDPARMKVMSSAGRAFIPLPSVVAAEAVDRFSLRMIGTTEKCREQFFAITTDRRIRHPAVAAITHSAATALEAP